MRKRIAKFALLSALALAPCNRANAYECLRTDLANVHMDSTRIILGEVVKIELIQAAQRDDATQMSEYVATLKPVETFRGRRDVEVRVRFRAGPRQFIILTDAEVIMVIGERYVVFEKGPDTLRYESICEDRVKKADREISEYVRSHTRNAS
jgi:hypothetical protein